MGSGIPNWFFPGFAMVFSAELIFAFLVRRLSRDIVFTLCCLMVLQALAAVRLLRIDGDEDWAAIAIIPVGILVTIVTLAGCLIAAFVVSDQIIKSVEDFLKHIEAHPPSGAAFRLALSDSFTFNDETGAGTSLIIAELIKRGYLPDGKPEQKSGYRIIQFKKTVDEPVA